MGYGRKPNRLYTGNMILTGTHVLSSSFEIINKVNFSGLTFIPTLDGFMQFDEDSGEYTFLKNGILFIDGTSNYNITTGNSRIEVSIEKYDGSWGYLNARSGTFPSLGPNQVHMAGKIIILKGQKLRFSTCVQVGSASYTTTVLSNTSVIPSAVVDFSLWS